MNLNLKPNEGGILECRGRIEGEYPIYILQSHPFARKLVERAHHSTLHGGVGMTMAKIREHYYWIPKLRQLVKRVRTECWGCKRFRAQSNERPPPPPPPPPGKLPTTRTKGTTPFEVLGGLRWAYSVQNERKEVLEILSSSLPL